MFRAGSATRHPKPKASVCGRFCLSDASCVRSKAISNNPQDEGDLELEGLDERIEIRISCTHIVSIIIITSIQYSISIFLHSQPENYPIYSHLAARGGIHTAQRRSSASSYLVASSGPAAYLPVIRRAPSRERQLFTIASENLPINPNIAGTECRRASFPGLCP